MSIVLRYFFDPGSGVCLWSGNAEAEARWGYAVDHAALPLRDGTRRFLQELVVRFDTSIDWSDPGAAGGRWSAEEWARFRAAAADGLSLLRRELAGQGYVFVDETGA